MKYRVSNAPVSLTRRYEAHLQSKRRGQALLLAVVVMLFVALISAGFLATVSGNLNQTARTSEKNSAIEAAKAGMAYINNRINSSPEGENWRTIIESPIPANASDPNYATYHSQLAEIQGLVAAGYSRFPAKASAALDAPQFYAKVERIGYYFDQRRDRNQARTVADDPEKEHAGMLKISVFGLAKNDPYAFHKMVAYRGGYEAAPIGRVSHSVSSFDFAKGAVTSGVIGDTAITAGATTLTLAKVKGNFPTIQTSTGYWVTIIDPNANVVARSFVTAYDIASQQLTVSAALPAIPANSTVEMAAALGAPLALDYDRDATASTTTESVSLSSADNTFFTSSRINGSAYWQGNAKMLGLRPKTTEITDTTYPQTVESSGLMVVDGDVKAGVDDATSVSVDSSTGTIDGSLISDAKNGITGNLDPLRQTKPFAAPDLTSQSNLARYRGLTRDSKPLLTANPADSSAYGYGQGIYIDNAQDREKVSTGTANQYREMTQQELIDLWTSTDNTKPEYRAPDSATVVLGATSDLASLEQKRLRGWVSQDEFKPRGVTIELFDRAGIPMIGITRDALTDGIDAANPSGIKAWKNPNGSAKKLVAGVPVPTDYYEEVPFNSTNGVIFAEGNVRIKGNNTSVNKSLTVVSLGNIYIEGSLGIDNDATTTNESTRKVLLLARKNVVVNPTTVISRPEAYTASTGASSVGTLGFDIPVYKSGGFEKGDYVQVSTVLAPLLVTDVPNDTTITVAQDPAITATDTVVRIAKDTIDATRRNPRLANYNAVLQRRIPTTPSTGTFVQKVTFRHIAEKIKAADVSLSVAATAATPATSATLFVKSLAAPATPGVIATAEKNFSLVENGAAPRNVTLTPFTQDLAALLTATNSTAITDWTYSFAYPFPELATVPAGALAGVGNHRPDSITAIPSTRDDWDLDILGGPKPIYLATSVSAATYGTSTDPLTNQSTIGATANNIKGFGFNPDPTGGEDTLTADQAFYEDNNSLTVDQIVLPDSREIVLPATTNSQGTFAFKLNKVTGLEDDTVVTAGDPLKNNRIPAYDLLGMRLDSIDPTGIGAGYTLKINAYVYAQTGSWVVIPGGYFDTNVKSAAIDLNRDGDTSDVGETTPYIQYSRYNYGIEFRGSIAENHPVLVNDEGTSKGIVKEWMDKWTYPTTTAGAWQPIKYQFDPTYLLGNLDVDPTGATDPQAGFYMPVANDITYQE